MTRGVRKSTCRDAPVNEWLCDLWQALGDEADAREWERVCWMLLGAAEYAERKNITIDPTLIDLAYDQARARKALAEAAAHHARVFAQSGARAVSCV